MKIPPWYVITGGPCAGKTTLVAELATRGYCTVSESARAYIETELAKGETLSDIRKDEAAFQRALIPMKVAAEESAPKDETVFFDRGMHDSIVYFALAGVEHDALLDAALKHASYVRAFLPDRLPFVQDHVRTEDTELADRIHQMLREAYEAAGIPVVRVPVLPVSKRADFVLAHL